MKTSTICKYTLVIICLLQSLGMIAQEVILTITTSPGNLAYFLGNQKNLVTDLTLSGSMNADDVACIRDMPQLSKLNMASISMVPGGLFYVSIGVPVEKDKIPKYMFLSLSNLTSVTLPTNITGIGNQAFQDCSGLTSITIPAGITAIDTLTFSNCSGLKSITIPSSVTTIYDYGLRGCSSLTSLTIPSSVTSIHRGAFAICTGLKEFIVSDTNPKFKSINGVLYSKDQSILLNYPNSKSSVFSIPDNTTSIAEWSFESCYDLASVTIPNSVTTIGDGAFFNCTGLISLSIGNSVTSIGTNVFYNCVNLPSVVIPNSVTYIGWDAFGYCRSLASISLSNKLNTIGIYAFTYCTSLPTITIPASVTSIDNWAFSYCTGLTAFHSNALTPPGTSSSAFNAIDKNICKLYVPKGTSAKYKASTGWSDFKTVIEENINSISETEAGNIKVYAEQNTIIIEGAVIGNEISVFNESGALLQIIKVTDYITRIYVPENHIYLIKITSKSFKVAL